MGRPDLDIAVRHESDKAVVTLAGEIDIGTAPRLTAAVEDALDASPTRVVLNMSAVTFCDSQGLGTLVVLNRAATRSRSLLVLSDLTDFLDRLLQVTGLHSAFTIQDGQKEE
ncbi:MAG: STAS domain-containing protein [Stackebrandtia sp.]